MDLVGDERAQSIQIGAVLLFGVLIIAFSSYQAFVIPQQNNEVEFTHNQEVQSDIQDLRNAIVSVPGSTSTQAVSIELSPRYPSRLVARNPGSPSGSLRTNGTTSMQYNITVRNAVAAGETGDVWDGSARPYNTGTIVYSPRYNVYNSAPTTYYGQSVAYNQFRSANISISEQAMVNGREITLVALNGSLSRTASGTASVDIQPVSRSDDSIVVSNNTATTNVSVSVPTRLPESVWEELFEDEIDDSPGDLSNDRYVADITATDGPGPYYNLTITFERGVDYRLRMAKAGVGNGVSSESEAYLTDVRGDGSSVANDTTTEVVLEVRDEYNNPVQGVTVYGRVKPGDGGSLTETEAVSDDDGRVTFEYDANGVTPGTQQLEFSYVSLGGSFDGSTPEDVVIDVKVKSSSGGGSSTGPSGFSSTSVSDLQANSGGQTQTVSFSPESQAILAGELITIDFGDAQASTVDYTNYNGITTSSSVSQDNVNSDPSTDTFTVELKAQSNIATSDTVTFDINGIDAGGQAGPLAVDFVREDTAGSETAIFNVGGGSSSSLSVDSLSATHGPPAQGNNKRDINIDFQASDSSGLDGVSYTVTVYQSSSKSSTNKMPSQQTGTFGAGDGTSASRSFVLQTGSQPPSPPYWVVVEVSGNGNSDSAEQATN